MNIKGIGVDIEEISRFRKLPYKSNGSFYGKIFTSAEMEYCLSKSDPYPSLAARFAAKEAALKCLRSTIYKVLDVEICNNRDGIPSVKIKGQRGNFLVSLSHTKDKAIAFVLWLN